MITDNEIRSLSQAEQFFNMAEAYVDAAVLQTSAVQKNADSSWPDASVALFLAAHGTELFLKAEILKRNSSKVVKDFSHSIRELLIEYRLLYPEPEYNCDFPFDFDEILSSMPKGVQDEINSPSMVFRYTVNKKNSQWQILNGFVASSFLVELRQLKQSMADLRLIF